MNQAAAESSDYMHTLLQLGQTLNSSLELEQVLNLAIIRIVNFMRAERGFILLVDEGTRRVWGRAAVGIEQDKLETALTAPRGDSQPEVSLYIVEEALHECHPVVSFDAMYDPRFAQRESVKLSHVRSVLCVPIIRVARESCNGDGSCNYCKVTRRDTCYVNEGRTLGVIYLDSQMEVDVFTEQDAEMLTAFANQASIAIENAHLYSNLRRSLEERLELQQKLHDQETRRLALEEANRFKSEFIGYVSHELRNPLTTIQGFIQTLNMDQALKANERAEFYDIIEAETDRMLIMINDLLDNSRLEANKTISLNLRESDLKSLLWKLERTARFDKYWTTRHSLEMDLPESLPPLYADKDKLVQIFVNLLCNAIKYSPQGGPIKISAARKDDGVEVSVSDSGVGMSEEQCEKLFSPYERLDRKEIKSIGGTGLGLYLTRHLVELHHGHIRCQSEPGRGTVFTVWLPENSESAESP